MSARRSTLTACALLAAIATAHASGQQRFVSRTAGVRVDVLVTDGSRRVSGLGADDFELLDNGVAQRVSALDLERVPLNVVCVFDTSGSMAGKRIQSLTAAGRSLVDVMRESDRIALLSFATHVSLEIGLTPDRERLRAAFTALTAAGDTSLRDATFAGLALRDADTARTLVIIFSDGDDTSSWLTAPQVIDAAKRTDVVVYAVQLQEPHMAMRRDDEHSRFLEDVSEETGGQLVQLKADADMTPAFMSILGGFRDRYVLSYAPSGVEPGGWHTLAVRVKGKPLKVIARRGYFGE